MENNQDLRISETDNKITDKSKFEAFFGIMTIDNIDEEIKNIRDEWVEHEDSINGK